MKRLLVAAFAAGVVVGACGDSSQLLASVGETEITAGYMSQLRDSYGRTINVTTPQFRDDLTQAIIREATRARAAAEFGISVTADEIGARIASPPAQWADLFARLAADSDVTETLVEAQAELTLLRDRVTGELIRNEEGLIARLISEAPQRLVSGCVRHILVETRSEALQVLDRLAAGEDFVSLAEELTLDVASGGDYVSGCPVSFAGFVDPFAQAAITGPLGAPVGPVETRFGFHVIRVDDRLGPPSPEEIAADPLSYVPESIQSDLFTPWFNQAVRDTEIMVVATVGSWSSAGVGIAPPER